MAEVNRYVTMTNEMRELMIDDLTEQCWMNKGEKPLSRSLRRDLRRLSPEDKKQVVEFQNKLLDTPVFMACKNGNVKIVDYLITRCNAKMIRPMEQRELEGAFSCLFIAIKEKNLKLVEMLLKKHVDVNDIEQNNEDTTPLHHALNLLRQQESPAIAKYLIDVGKADVTTTDHWGTTCLMKSCPFVGLSKLILDHGGDADINAQNCERNSALHYAISGDYVDSFKLLLDRGADREIKNANNEDILMDVCMKKAKKIFDYIVEKKQLFNYTNQRIADAFDLIGANFVKTNQRSKALNYWKLSLKFRQDNLLDKKSFSAEDTDDKNLKNLMQNVFENLTEFQTEDDLESLALNDIKIQSVLIMMRILGAYNDHTIVTFIDYIDTFLQLNNGNRRCVNFYLFVMQLKISHTGRVLYGAEDSTIFFRLDKEILERVIIDGFEDTLIIVQTLITLFDKCEKLFKTDKDFNIGRYNYIFCLMQSRIIDILTQLNSMAESEDEKNQLKVCVKSAVKINYLSLVHNTILQETVIRFNMFNLPYEQVVYIEHFNFIKLLLECGADVNKLTNDGYTALYLAAHPACSDSAELLQLLLKANGNIYLTCDSGWNTLDVLLNDHDRQDELQLDEYKTWLPPSLKEITAKHVIKNQIPYENLSDEALIKYIDDQK